jgi:hypothetical protein
MPEARGVAARVGVILCLLLSALYLITYTGRIESGDEYRIVDGITSLVHFGDTGRDESLWFAPPDALVTVQRYPVSPLPEDEASLAVLAAPLYLLAHAVPGLGLLHVVWLYNIIVTVLTSVIVYATGLTMGYGWRPALLVAVALGVGTIAWPYSRTLFRDPTVMMLIAFCFWMALTAKQHRGRAQLLALMLMAGGILAAAWVKITALFALPALLVFAAPTLRNQPTLRRMLYALIILTLAASVLVAFVPDVAQIVQQIIPAGVARWFHVTTYTQIAVHSYLFSANGSIWGASPVLLLCLPGAALLMWCGKPRLVSAALLLVVSYAVGHAYLTGVHWFGGLSIPPRFMLPVLPLVVLLILPIAQAALNGGSRLAMLGVAVAVVFSGWVQWVNSVSFPQTFVGLLPRTSQGLAEWLPALNELQYARWLLQPQTWGALGWDTAWWRSDQALWAWGNAGLIVITMVLVLRVRPAANRPFDVALWVTGLLLVGVNVSGLLLLNQRDPFVKAERTAMQEVMAYLQQHAAPGDPLVVPYGTFEMYLLNYNRSYDVRPLVMPKQPGEAISARIPGEVQSPRVLDLLTWFTVRALHHLSLHHDRAWLIMDTNAFQPWATRVIEHFMAVHYYYVREIPTSDPEVRLIEFALQPQPFASVLRQPDVQTDLVYGELMALKGVTVTGDGAAPGGYVTFELTWQALQPVPVPVTVSVFMATEDGRVVAQGGDSMPVGGFAPTTGWAPAVSVSDRRAIAIPADVVPGTYQLWVVVYRFVDGMPVRYNVSGAKLIDSTIGVLPVTINVDFSPDD